MKNVHNGLGVKKISDLLLKEIHSIWKTKNLANKQIQKYKLTGRESFEKYDNLNKHELNTKTNHKNVYVKNDVMSTVIKCCRGEKKGGKKNRRI